MLDLTGVTCQSSRDPEGVVLFGNLGYRQQLATMINAGIFSRMNDDMGLMNKMRLWIDGQVGEVKLPDDQQLHFYDPVSGYTYVARLYGTETIDGKTVEKGIGSRMLQKANSLASAAYDVQMSGGVPVTDKFGALQLILDAEGQPKVVSPYWKGKLDRYVGVVEAMRQVGYTLGFGPLDGSSSP